MTGTVQAAPVSPAPATATRQSWGLLPARLRGLRPPAWWQEVLFIGVVYELYSLVRNAVPEHTVAAHHRATDIVSAERFLHVDVEKSLNSFVAHTHWLAYASNYYYATLHFIVTIGVLVWLYRRHPLRYRSLRTVIMATNVVALAGFYTYALAPPRMLSADGFVDTVVHFHTWGSWGSSGVDSASNQYAAMPSLHIAWALWCALVLVTLARRRWVKVLACAYPVVTLFVIVGTANHYVLDAVGGVTVLGLGFGVQRLLTGRPALRWSHLTVPAQSKNTRS
jgi:hypothetical protein